MLIFCFFLSITIIIIFIISFPFLSLSPLQNLFQVAEPSSTPGDAMAAADAGLQRLESEYHIGYE